MLGARLLYRLCEFYQGKGFFQEDHVVLDPVPEDGILSGPARDKNHSQVRVLFLESESQVSPPPVAEEDVRHQKFDGFGILNRLLRFSSGMGRKDIEPFRFQAPDDQPEDLRIIIYGEGYRG